MKRDNKHRWLERLRDPKSKKARGKLANSKGGMCCLGHLEDMLCGLDPKYYDDTDMGSVAYKMSGLKIGEACRLARLNDRCAGFPIAEIEALPEWD